jgi:hypothetical protein
MGPTSRDWYRLVIVPGVDPGAPGLYEWRIEGIGCYIGQYTRARRPQREYDLNVGRKLAGRPYRKGNPDGFRKIHAALADAAEAGRPVTLTLLENQSDKADCNRRECELIEERRSRAADGGLPVLNSTPLTK